MVHHRTIVTVYASYIITTVQPLTVVVVAVVVQSVVCTVVCPEEAMREEKKVMGIIFYLLHFIALKI